MQNEIAFLRIIISRLDLHGLYRRDEPSYEQTGRERMWTGTSRRNVGNTIGRKREVSGSSGANLYGDSRSLNVQSIFGVYIFA
jgi:hypothetical protein